MLKDKLHHLPRLLSLALLLGIAGILAVSFIKRSGRQKPPLTIPKTTTPLSEKVLAITDGYYYTSNENGRAKFHLTATRDTAYADGHHELEKLDLVAFAPDGRESSRIRADRGLYEQEKGLVTFTGHVVVTDAEGLEVTTEALSYDQQSEIARTEVAVNFRRGEMTGSSVGAVLNTKERKLELLRDAHLMIASHDKAKNSPPLEIRGHRADYAQAEGRVHFAGEVNVAQGEQNARADGVTGLFNQQTHQLERVEARGNVLLKSQGQGKTSELQAREMDFFFDEAQHLKQAIAVGAARARSLEKDAPREITAEKLEARYTPTATGSELSSVVSQGRTQMKLAAAEGPPNRAASTERVLEADVVQVTFRAGGKNLQRAEANGNAVLTVTPRASSPTAERKRLRAPRFTAEFFETGNAIKTFLADGGPIAEFEPLATESKRQKRVLSGKRLMANFSEQIQEVADATMEGEVKFTEGDRHATAATAIYQAAASLVTLRGKPVVWDTVARTNADEIDANLETGESVMRGRVRTTYYSRETSGGAAPFKKSKAPVFIAADRARIRHREGAARYEGNARAWQDDNFVRGETIELDRNERMMSAAGAIQSALYSVEREVEKGRKEVVPIFATADRMTYTDANRVVHYEGEVKIKQGPDRIEAAVAEVAIDEEHKLSRLTAVNNVVLTQPARRGTGDRVEYTAATDTAVLTGNLARVEDREREVTTSGPRLTLHLRDAKIALDDDGGTKRVRTTHRIQR
jgi:lipopolysaccharide export system protein LptA